MRRPRPTVRTVSTTSQIRLFFRAMSDASLLKNHAKLSSPTNFVPAAFWKRRSKPQPRAQAWPGSLTEKAEEALGQPDVSDEDRGNPDHDDDCGDQPWIHARSFPRLAPGRAVTFPARPGRRGGLLSRVRVRL